MSGRYDAELEQLSKLSLGVERVARKLRGHDVETIRKALQALGEFRALTEDLKILSDKLLDIEKTHASDVGKFPDQVGKVDLAASILALSAVQEFFRLRAVSHNLQMLYDGLIEIAVGASPAAMFHPEDYPKGRRAASPLITAAKGAVAAMMHVQQSTGMARKEAAKWVVRHISPTLAARLSKKPLTPRVVEEWLDRFGGDHAEYNAGRDKYRFLLGLEHGPLSPQRFREITDHMAKRLLIRKSN